jgi:hypothetical protein
MRLTKETKKLLKRAQYYCDIEDKSTEFMLQYMQDVANVDLDAVLYYLETFGGFEKIDK